MAYYFSGDGAEVEGPVSVEELRALITAGQLGRGSQVCAEDSETWQSLEVALPQLFTASRRPPPPPGRRSSDGNGMPDGPSASGAGVTRVEVSSTAAGAELTRPEVASSDLSGSAAIPGTGGTFGGYRLLRPLRVVSGEAELWEAERQGERRVLKIYHRDLRPKAEVIELMQSLEPTHVVRIYETGEVDGRFYEVQELIEHGSLADLTKLGGVVERKAREILGELAAALEQLHGRRPAILHRDIKPGNVLVRSLEPLNLVLTDFGIASAAELSQHKTSVSRTAAYAAPEALQGTVSKASDWWSVGVMLVELITGRHPYAGLDEHAVNFQIVTRGVPISAEVPERWRPLLQGLLTRDPAKRWGLVEVKQWLEGATNIPVHVEPPLAATGTGATATHRPYKFGGQEYYEAAELGEALAQRWDEAVKHLGRGYIAKWVEEDLRDASLANTLADLAEAKDLKAEQRFAVALLAMSPQLPLAWRGEMVTLEWVQAQAVQAKKLLNSPVPEWLERMRSDDWLLKLRQSWEGEMAVLRQLTVPVDDFNLELAEELLLREEPPLLAEAHRQAGAYGGSKNVKVDALLKAPEWNKIEAIAFLVCRRDLLITIEQIREQEVRELVAKLLLPRSDDQQLHQAVQMEHPELAEAVRELRLQYPVSTSPRVNALLQAENIGDVEARLLLACPRGSFLTFAQIREKELRQNAADCGVSLDENRIRECVEFEDFKLFEAAKDLRLKFVGSIEPRLDALLHSEQLTEAEALLLITCKRVWLLTADERAATPSGSRSKASAGGHQTRANDGPESASRLRGSQTGCRQHPRYLWRVIKWLGWLALLVCATIIVLYKTYAMFILSSDGMAPAIEMGKRIIVNKLTYLLNAVERGDVVAFASSKGFLISRIVGLPGESIEIRDKAVYVNGKKLNDDWGVHSDSHVEANGPRDNFGPIDIPPGKVFVLGDNRDRSVVDSRFYGCVGQESIVGRVSYGLRIPNKTDADLVR